MYSDAPFVNVLNKYRKRVLYVYTYIFSFYSYRSTAFIFICSIIFSFYVFFAGTCKTIAAEKVKKEKSEERYKLRVFTETKKKVKENV